MAIEEYPSVLPNGLQSGRAYNTTSTIKRSTMVTGRALQRKKYPDVPTYVTISWMFNSAETQAFEGWFRDVINDGASWFNCPLKTPLGLDRHTVRFTDTYKGPSLVGPDQWSVSGELEMLKRPLVPAGEGEFPEDIVESKIFDLTMNREWPTG